jgi:hypothetical protein
MHSTLVFKRLSGASKTMATNLAETALTEYLTNLFVDGYVLEKWFSR